MKYNWFEGETLIKYVITRLLHKHKENKLLKNKYV